MSVAFVREESAEAAQEVSLPPRAISAHPNLVTQSGLRALEHALADSRQALNAAQTIADANDRRRALELAARDVRYFAERVGSAIPQPEPSDTVVVAFGFTCSSFKVTHELQGAQVERSGDPDSLRFASK